MAALKADGASIVIGAYSSELSVPASLAASDAGLVYWEAGAVADQLTGRGLPLVFRVGASGTNLGSNSATFAPHAARRPARESARGAPPGDRGGERCLRAVGRRCGGCRRAERRGTGRGARHVQPDRAGLADGDEPAAGGSARRHHPRVAHPGRHRLPPCDARREPARRGPHRLDDGRMRPGLRGRARGRRDRDLRLGSPDRGFQPAALDPAALALYERFATAWATRDVSPAATREYGSPAGTTGTSEYTIAGPIEAGSPAAGPSEEGLSGFSAGWALFHDALPAAARSGSVDAGPVAAAARSIDLPSGSSPTARGQLLRRPGNPRAEPAGGGRDLAVAGRPLVHLRLAADVSNRRDRLRSPRSMTAVAIRETRRFARPAAIVAGLAALVGLRWAATVSMVADAVTIGPVLASGFSRSSRGAAGDRHRNVDRPWWSVWLAVRSWSVLAMATRASPFRRWRRRVRSARGPVRRSWWQRRRSSSSEARCSTSSTGVSASSARRSSPAWSSRSGVSRSLRVAGRAARPRRGALAGRPPPRDRRCRGTRDRPRGRRSRRVVALIGRSTTHAGRPRRRPPGHRGGAIGAPGRAAAVRRRRADRAIPLARPAARTTRRGAGHDRRDPPPEWPESPRGRRDSGVGAPGAGVRPNLIRADGSPGARGIKVAITPVHPDVAPASGHIDSNVYRISVTDDSGTPLTAPASAGASSFESRIHLARMRRSRASRAARGSRSRPRRRALAGRSSRS